MTNKLVQSTPQWLRQRQLGKQHGAPSTTREQIMRLKLDKTLTGHHGCVNCMQWNNTGQVLVSGSDDCNVVIWQNPAGPKVRKNIIKTNHQGNILSVKIMPNSMDDLIATSAADKTVKVMSVSNEKSLLDCTSCHQGRVKEIGVHPNESTLLWSVGEDGMVMEYDLRSRHTCKSGQSIMLDLSRFSDGLKGKSLANHPLREELIAIGTTNSYIFLFDRRLLPRNKPNSTSTDCCTAYFSPGCPTDPMKRAQHLLQDTYTVSHVAFSSDGRELLANINKDQIYLFSMDEPDEQYKSYDLSVRHLINNDMVVDNCTIKKQSSKTKTSFFNFKTKTQWDRLVGKERKFMTPDLELFVNQVGIKLKLKKNVRKHEHDKLNELINKNPTCVELYNTRASALMHRAWYGDCYQALRDTCCALAIDPFNAHSMANLITCSDHVGEIGTYFKLMNTIGNHYGEEKKNQVCQKLMEFITELNNNMTDDVNQNENKISPQECSLIPDFMGYPKPTLGIANLWESRADYRFISDRFPGSQRFHPSPDYVHPFDYNKRFCGHCNIQTDIKEANFFGINDEFIVSGSDDGAFFIWDKNTTNIVKACQADMQIVNCLQPHPNDLLLATSGIENNIKLWSPSGEEICDVMALDTRCSQNQEFLNDPWDNLMRIIFN